MSKVNNVKFLLKGRLPIEHPMDHPYLPSQLVPRQPAKPVIGAFS
jgi:hypothetical protein